MMYIFYRKGKPNYWVPNLNLKPENNITREIGAGIQLDGLLTDNDRLQLKADISERMPETILPRAWI